MTVTTNQLRINYQKIGRGPTLVLLHGWGCDWQIWSPLITQLSEKFELVLIDLPAFGVSETPKTVWSSPDYAEFLVQFLKDTNLKPYAIMGHSFGGKIAALYAAEFTAHSLKKLILVSTSGLPDKPSTYHQLQMGVLGLVPQSVKNSLPRTLKQRFLKATGSASDNFNSTPAQQQILKKIVHENINDALVKIELPTLLIWGDQDQDTPLHQAQQFQRLIPHAQLEILTNVGHFPFIEQPRTFMQLVTKFLEHE